MRTPSRALFSVHTKYPKHIDLAYGLMRRGWPVFTTRGTGEHLSADGRIQKIAGAGDEPLLRSAQELTGLTETEELKTVSPRLYAMIRGQGPTIVYDNRTWPTVDFVCVDLKPGDVGGFGLIRCAMAGRKLLVTEPQHCDMALDLIDKGHDVGAEKELAAAAYAHCFERLAIEARPFMPHLIVVSA